MSKKKEKGLDENQQQEVQQMLHIQHILSMGLKPRLYVNHKTARVRRRMVASMSRSVLCAKQ